MILCVCMWPGWWGGDDDDEEDGDENDTSPMYELFSINTLEKV